MDPFKAVINRILPEKKSVEKRSNNPSALISPLSWLINWGVPSSSGENVSEAKALKVATVFTCIRVLAESIASLDVGVYQKTGNVTQRVNGHNVGYLISTQPNDYMTAYDYWFVMVARMMGWGKSYSYIDGSRNGEIRKIDFVEPWKVRIQDYTPSTGIPQYTYYLNGSIIDPSRLVHINAFTIDGVTGLSPILVNSESIGLAIKQEKYSGGVYGLKPPGYISTDQELDEQQARDFSDRWAQMVERGDGKFPPVLSSGSEFKAITISPEDAQFIETRRLTKEDIYGIFRVPPSLAQDYGRATWNNAEQQNLVFTKYTLLPIVRNIQAELNLKLFSKDEIDSGFFIKFDLNSLMQGDFKTRTEGFRSLWNSGAITADEIREANGMNPLPNNQGQRPYVPMNMVPADRIDETLNRAKEKQVIEQLQLNENGKH